MYDIHYDQIEKVLNKISNRVPIKVLDAYNEPKTLYLDHFHNGAWWCSNQGNTDIKIWPSNVIKILSIGNKTCQSRESYKEEKSASLEYDNSKRHQIHKDKYKHFKQNNNEKN